MSLAELWHSCAHAYSSGHRICNVSAAILAQRVATAERLQLPSGSFVQLPRGRGSYVLLQKGGACSRFRKKNHGLCRPHLDEIERVGRLAEYTQWWTDNWQCINEEDDQNGARQGLAASAADSECSGQL